MSGSEAQLTRHVAGLMRAGGWQQVSIAAAMGHLGTDVYAVGVDGRRWVVRCHPDAALLAPSDVRRFADGVRQTRRGDVVVLVAAGFVPAALRQAAQLCGITLVDRDALDWWARVQTR